MAELSNCPNCGRLFSYDGRSNLCVKCTDVKEREFRKIRVFLSRNPGVTVMEIAQATQVDNKIILQFIREGRLLY